MNPPTGSESSRRNISITAQLWLWAEANSELGVAFESPGGFTLPNGATRAANASWVSRERWDALTLEEQESFAPVCPDFVAALRSKTDSFPKLQDKMWDFIKHQPITTLNYCIQSRIGPD